MEKIFDTYSSTVIADRENGEVRQHLKFLDELIIHDTKNLDEAMIYSLSDELLEKLYNMCILEMLERGL